MRIVLLLLAIGFYSYVVYVSIDMLRHFENKDYMDARGYDKFYTSQGAYFYPEAFFINIGLFVANYIIVENAFRLWDWIMVKTYEE